MANGMHRVTAAHWDQIVIELHFKTIYGHVRQNTVTPRF